MGALFDTKDYFGQKKIQIPTLRNGNVVEYDGEWNVVEHESRCRGRGTREGRGNILLSRPGLDCKGCDRLMEGVGLFAEQEEEEDPVDHPRHYNNDPSAVECIDVVEHRSFNVGNAMKYLWRAGKKGDEIQDLEKARWYVDREIQRLKKDAPPKRGAP